MKKILGVLLTSTVLTTAALANGAPAPAPAACPACPAAAAADFTGFKLGLNLGLGHGSNTHTQRGLIDVSTQQNPNQTFTINNRLNLSSKGMIAGLHVGYDKQLSKNFLLGAEFSFDFSGIKGRQIEITNPATNLEQLDRDNRFKQSWTMATVARAGFVHESTAFYGLAGWVATKSTLSSRVFTNNSKTLNGVRFGAGIAHKMNKIVLGLEGTYDMFGKNSRRFLPGGGNTSDYTTTVEPNVLAVKAKISYAF